VRRENIFFAAFFAVVGILAVIVLQPFLNFIVLAGILTYTLFPLYGFFYARMRRPSLSAALAVVVTLLVMVLPAVFLISEGPASVGRLHQFEAAEHRTHYRLRGTIHGL